MTALEFGELAGLAGLLAMAVNLGRQAGRIEKAVAVIEPKLVALEKIPSLEQRIEFALEQGRRNTSHIDELREKNGEMRGRLDSITEET